MMQFYVVHFFTGQMTQPTVSQRRRTMVSQAGQGPIAVCSAQVEFLPSDTMHKRSLCRHKVSICLISLCILKNEYTYL